MNKERFKIPLKTGFNQKLAFNMNWLFSFNITIK